MNHSASVTWYLYLLETRRGMLYTGITTDVARRLAQHEAGQGAKALRGRGPLTLVHHEPVGSHGEALRLEAEVKRLSAARKRAWLQSRRERAQEHKETACTPSSTTSA
ncbi:GIY-YIG nuclease family protein [Halomonas desiderata]|uniref:GIY-YIG nuclease family protein n=1 Tax=Billgrantia desiderata TaxID=52021 RepID=A0AAW4YSD6_9GAMM|nr:GIY-YIG nuclease family protein [Halomonas desiderata]MCE8013548.1 GIY-YIG nuclease family protein [Halomonas desiderata]MCE8041258.1 GIY-YIG nuclease family protein [Halomonas desiderata]MCE8045833.1 GIY-YIG nuclease family protein [Halomonas desiderata]MCE8051471.1 GIY-YIG nuclease family protein [Halomonas desiderata]NIC35275.1 GIY-YIG nuclease family protein [Halomonas desiderata]